MRRRTTAVNVTLVVALLVVGAVGYALLAGEAEATTTDRTDVVQRGTVVATVTASGTVTSPGDVGVSFADGGTVTSVQVDVGEQVRAGQLLATVDDTAAREGVAAATSALASARSSLADANGEQTSADRAAASADEDRAETEVRAAETAVRQARESARLSARGYDLAVERAQDDLAAARAGGDTAEVAAAEQALQDARLDRTTGHARDRHAVESAEDTLAGARAGLEVTRAQNAAQAAPQGTATVTAAREQVDAARAQLTVARATLDDTELRAPVAGIVASIDGRVGEQAGTGSTSTSETTTAGSPASGFVVLTGVDDLQVEADFSEADAAQVQVGAGAAVTFEALPGADVNAEVVAISPLPQTTNDLTTYTVTLSLIDPPASVRAGLTTTVAVVAEVAEDALFVPSSAVTSLGGTDTVTVRTGEGEAAVDEQRAVVLGIRGDTTTQVVDGLAEGETVVITSSSSGLPGGFPPGGIPGGLGGLGG